MIWGSNILPIKFNNNIVSFIVIIILIIGSLPFVLNFGSKYSNVSADIITVNDDGGADYSKIQDAINASKPGDTIYVWAGTYYENIIINKTLTLMGNGTENTIINGNGNKDVVQITTNWVNFTRFKIINSGMRRSSESYAGLKLINAQYVHISNLNCSRNYQGIIVDLNSNNNTIINNEFTSNEWSGIFIAGKYNKFFNNYCRFNKIWGIFSFYDSGYNEISNNICNYNNKSGISTTSGSINNIISNNICNSNYNYGIYGFPYFNHNSLINNTCKFNNWSGIHLNDNSNNITIINNTCESNYGHGILINDDSENNNITNNKCYLNNGSGFYINSVSKNNLLINNICNLNNENGIEIDGNSLIIKNNIFNSNKMNGIYIWESNNNAIFDNICSNNNKSGIYIYESDYNIISNNEILNNSDYGVKCSDSLNNQIFHNYLKNNSGETSQGYDDGSNNKWGDGYPSGGNYWDDYSGIDIQKGPNQNQKGSDSIGDTPYHIYTPSHINGNLIKDNYPLMLLRAPFPPINLQVNAGNGYIRLNWSTPIYDGGANITKFKIYKGMESDNETFLTLINKTQLNFNDTRVMNGQTYFYYVTAWNIVGESNRSDEINATPFNEYKTDKDNDQIPDEWEHKYGLKNTDPTDAELDSDNDKLTNLEEYLNRTNPFDPDTDNDTFNDGLEIDKNTDPLDDKDYPLEEDKEKVSENVDYIIYFVLIGIVIFILILLSLYFYLKKKREKE